jgi:hypothetical protein
MHCIFTRQNRYLSFTQKMLHKPRPANPVAHCPVGGGAGYRLAFPDSVDLGLHLRPHLYSGTANNPVTFLPLLSLSKERICQKNMLQISLICGTVYKGFNLVEEGLELACRSKRQGPQVSRPPMSDEQTLLCCTPRVPDPFGTVELGRYSIRLFPLQ